MVVKSGNLLQTFETENEVMDKIRELRKQGVTENNMYVMAQDEGQIGYIKRETDIDCKTADGDWIDKFMGFLSGRNTTEEAIERMGIDENETEHYRSEIENGKILLYADREAERDSRATNTTGTDPNLGAGAGGFGASSGLYAGTGDESSTLGQSRIKTTESAGVGENRGTGFGLGQEVSQEQEEPLMFSEGKNWQPEGMEAGEKNTDTTDEQRMQLHEERLNVDKTKEKIGEVNVGKHVVEEEQRLDVPIEREEVYVERRPVSGEQTATNHRFGGKNSEEEIRIPLTEEQVNVTKQDVVNEEIVVGKRKVQDTETINETVKREEADIDENGRVTNKRNTQNDEPLNL